MLRSLPLPKVHWNFATVLNIHPKVTKSQGNERKD